MKIKSTNQTAAAGITLLISIILTACSADTSTVVQGYVEADFVYVASPGSGRLEKLAVKRGDTVSEGQILFELEKEPEKSQADEAQYRLKKARKQLADLKKGLRPTEVNSLQENLREARANLELARIEFDRRKKLLKSGTISIAEYDLARTDYDRKSHQVKKFEADLETAQMGSREDQVSAALSEVKSAQALLKQALWKFGQKKQAARSRSVVFDTLYREGEWVPAGKPVVTLLPPENRKVRFYVPQELAGSFSINQKVKVSWDGASNPVTAEIRFISPEVEYTPPIIYSSRSRSKLVIMIEAVPLLLEAVKLHPGQPVDIILPTGE